MIKHVRTVGFKGFDLDEDVPKKAIYTGRNKSGKSTRAGAIAIALYGHIPFSTAGKRPSDILDSFGKDELIASVTIDGTEFARKFSRNAKGGVSQSMQIDKKRASSDNFAILLHKAGVPRIADVAEFMKQSDTKKTDTLFELFPNNALSGIDTEIENAKVDVSNLERRKNGAESTVVRLTNSKHGIELPSGNIASTQAEIKSVESQITDLENQIKEAEIEEAKEKAKEEGRIEGERLEKERVKKEELDAKIEEEIVKDEKIDDPIDVLILEGEKQIADFKSTGKFEEQPRKTQEHSPPKVLQRAIASQSIQRIIGALKGAGCGTCAALVVAKQELKKFKETS